MLKGVAEGVLIRIDDFEKDIEDLKRRLETTSFFTRGTDFLLLAKDKEYYKSIEKILEEYGHNLYLIKRVGKKEEKKKIRETIILKEKIHGGQRIEVEGNILFLGDLNHGAELVATGDIYIMGKARGNIHAGSSGDNSREIIALGMEVSHFKIGDLLAQNSCEENIESLARAYVVDRNIVIEEFKTKNKIQEEDGFVPMNKRSLSSYFSFFKKTKI